MLLRFGPYELNPASFELRRSGRRQHLPSRPLELLLLLIERRGTLVSREQIAQSLWPGLQVEDLGARINTAVAQIRAALAEDASKPRYLETVIGKGYRFIGEVEQVEEVGESVKAGSSQAGADRLIGPLSGKGAAAVQTGATATMDLPQAPGVLDVPTSELAEQPAMPLTIAPVRQRFRLSLLLAALAVPVLLGTIWAYRALHPDPDRDAVPASAHRQITTNDAEHPVSVAAISPDGTLLAYVDPTGTFIEELATGRTRLIPGVGLRASRLAWFTDQNRLLLTGFQPNSDQAEIWMLSAVGGGAPQLFHRSAADGAPAPDGRTIAFTVEHGREIRLAAADGTAERPVTRGGEGELLGKLFWSPDGRRIGFEQRSAPQRPGPALELSYVWSYHSIEVATGRETAAMSDLSFDSAGETADGTLYYLRAKPFIDRAHLGLWRVKTDRETGAFLDKPERVQDFAPPSEWTGMSVSRDGRIAAIQELGQKNLCYGRLAASGKSLYDVKRLTTRLEGGFPYSWSKDDQVIYYESSRLGPKSQIFRQSIDSPNAELLTTSDLEQRFPVLMSDGKTLVYEEWRPRGGSNERFILRADANASHPELVTKEEGLDEWRCPLISGTSCVLRKTEGQRLFVFYALSLDSGPGAGQGQELAHTNWQPSVMGDWALSPDGRTAAIPNHDAIAPAIRLLSLSGSEREYVINVHQTAQLWGIHWAADGRGFYAEMRSGPTHRLTYISLAGEVTTVRETSGNTWAIPSHDGRRLAFTDSSEARNVYLWR